MKAIIQFYDDLFLYHYNKLKGKDSDPEAIPGFIISLCQSANIMIVYILLAYFFDLDKILPIQYSIFVFFVFFLALNTYIYDIKDRKKTLLKKNEIKPKMGLKSVLYVLLSLFIPLIIIYFFNEFGNGFE